MNCGDLIMIFFYHFLREQPIFKGIQSFLLEDSFMKRQSASNGLPLLLE